MKTLGNARALGLEAEIGRSRSAARPTSSCSIRRHARHGASHGHDRRDLAETLFVLMTLGDDRAVRATYVPGDLAHPAA